MVAAAREKIEEIETPELIAMVDVRDIRERQRTGFIPGSVHAPSGMIEFWVDSDSPYYRDVFGQDGKRYVLHCAGGGRSSLAAATLQDMGFEAAHHREGFSSWTEQGGPVEQPETRG